MKTLTLGVGGALETLGVAVLHEHLGSVLGTAALDEWRQKVNMVAAVYNLTGEEKIVKTRKASQQGSIAKTHVVLRGSGALALHRREALDSAAINRLAGHRGRGYKSKYSSKYTLCGRLEKVI